MKKIKLTREFVEKIQKLNLKGLKIKPMSEQVATEWEKEHAKKLAIKYQGQYGYPKIKN